MTKQDHGELRGRIDLNYDPKGHDHLRGRFDLGYVPKMSH